MFFLIFLHQILNAKVAKAEKLKAVSVQYKYANIGGLFLKQSLKQALKTKTYWSSVNSTLSFICFAFLSLLFPFKSHKLL